MLERLDNIAWHALTGAHARFASGSGDVRRYARGFSPIVAFANPARPDFTALADHFDLHEPFYCEGPDASVPEGWRIEAETTMFKMYWDADVPGVDEALDAFRLGPQHAAQAFELAMTTRPGPFGPRTIELGEYFGYFEGEKLVAMAGERMHAGTLREISGVCTDPDHQGRGFASRLMLKLVRREMIRDERPFLHVMHDNTAARRLYEKLGFRNYREVVVRVLSRTA